MEVHRSWSYSSLGLDLHSSTYWKYIMANNRDNLPIICQYLPTYAQHTAVARVDHLKVRPKSVYLSQSSPHNSHHRHYPLSHRPPCSVQYSQKLSLVLLLVRAERPLALCLPVPITKRLSHITNSLAMLVTLSAPSALHPRFV